MGNLNITLPTATGTMMSDFVEDLGLSKNLRKHKRVWVGKGMVYNGGGLTAITFCSSVKLCDSFLLTALAHYLFLKATKRNPN